MRIIRATLLIFGLILIIGMANAAEVAVIPSTQIITPGETFNMNVSINPQGTAIAGAQLDIAFNRSLIRVNNITEGDIFKQSGANTFFNSGIIDNSTGNVINIFNAIIGKNNVSAQGTFIIINATALGTSGITGVNLSNVKISDPNGNPVGLTVTNGSIMFNSPPLLAYIGNKIVNEGQTLTFTLSASDADGDTLTYLATGLPGGASFNPATRTFQWTPNYTQSGNYSVHFEVSDDFYIDEENIIIIVNNVNGTAPSITVVSPNGGETWARGTVRTIGWTSSGNPGAYVRIELMKGSVVNRVITSSTPNDGAYSWTIRRTQTLGNDYKVRISSTANSTYIDTSNSSFRISS